MKKPTTIKQKIRRLFFLLSITTLVLATVLALSGMLVTRDKMESMGEQLGASAKISVTEIVSSREESRMKELVHEKVQRMDMIFSKVANDVKVIDKTLEEILSEPQKYLPKEEIRPQSVDDGWSPNLVLTPVAVNNLENLRGQIALARNIQNVLKNVALTYDVSTSIYTAYEAGFMVVINTEEGDRKNFFENPSLEYRVFDFFDRQWYKNPKAQNELIFSDAFLNAAIYKESKIMPIITCSAPITLNGEFIGVTGIGFSIEGVAEIALNTSIGQTGFGFLLNKDGQVVVSPKDDGDLAVKDDFPDLRESSEESLANAAKKMTSGEKGSMTVILDGEEYFLVYEPLENVNWSFGALVKISEVTAPADNLAMIIDKQTNDFIDNTENFSFKLLPFVAFAFVALLGAVSILSERLTKYFVKPIQELSDGVREISSGNFDKKLNIQTGDELEHLSTSFNAMTDELKTYMANLTKVTAEKERVATELNVATNIQQSMLPHDFDFGRNDFEIYASMQAAKKVGGDFYDFYLLDDNHLMITIADVSGKGITAALFMAASKVILKNFAMTMKSPDDLNAVMTLANQQICQGNDEMMFVTVFMGLLDLKTGKFIYVNGGHNPPIIYHDAEKKFRWLDVEQNCVVGLMEDMDFEQQEIQLSKGDIIFMYTDGVTEAMSATREQYGEERLENCLNNLDHQCKLETLLEGVKKSLANHVQDAEQSDDITMLAVRLDKDSN